MTVIIEVSISVIAGVTVGLIFGLGGGTNDDNLVDDQSDVWIKQ